MANNENKYMISFFLITLIFVLFLSDNKVYSQNELSNNSLITSELESINPQDQIRYETYTDVIDKYSLNYPSNWKIDKNSLGILSIESPLENKTDPYVDVILVSINNISEGSNASNIPISFDELIERELDYLKLANDFELIESSSINLNNIDNLAHKFVYTYSDPSIGDAKALDIMIPHNNKIFYLSYITKPMDYEKNIEIAQQVFDSFEFTKDNTGTNYYSSEEFLTNLNNFPNGKFDDLMQFNDTELLLDFGKSLSNSIFNNTSLFSVLSYSLVDGIKVTGAKIVDKNSVNITLDHNFESTTNIPSVTVVVYKIDIDMRDLFSFLISDMSNADLFEPRNSFKYENVPIFDIISHFKIGSNVIGSGWSTPVDIPIKVNNGIFEHKESDTSILLIQVIPMG